MLTAGIRNGRVPPSSRVGAEGLVGKKVHSQVDLATMENRLIRCLLEISACDCTLETSVIDIDEARQLYRVGIRPQTRNECQGI